MSAVISDCGEFRYALWRDVAPLDGNGQILFVMLNPSTADADQDDPTIRRCVGFARRWGFASLAVGNLFGLRATSPERLVQTNDAVGPDNDRWLGQLIRESRWHVVAWGANPVAVHRADSVLRMLSVPSCLGLTKDGAPRHPLYVAADAEPIPFQPNLVA